MTVHVGELTSQVEVRGVDVPPAAGAAGGRPRVWDEYEHHRELAEDLADRDARTAGGGFDG